MQMHVYLLVDVLTLLCVRTFASITIGNVAVVFLLLALILIFIILSREIYF